LNYERRFTKLGYSAASVLQALPYLRMLVDESHLSNQHIEIVRMFLDTEFLITELQVIAYFTHVITLPFLYFVERDTSINYDENKFVQKNTNKYYLVPSVQRSCTLSYYLIKIHIVRHAVSTP
jgi:hypothetical protein